MEKSNLSENPFLVMNFCTDHLILTYLAFFLNKHDLFELGEKALLVFCH